jgi:tRNA A37 N6-isopentenylltransferase MiaA
MEFLEGKLLEKDMVDQVKAHTRQFVRRQEIWFRSMPGMTRMPIGSDRDLGAAPHAIASALENRQVA